MHLHLSGALMFLHYVPMTRFPARPDRQSYFFGPQICHFGDVKYLAVEPQFGNDGNLSGKCVVGHRDLAGGTSNSYLLLVIEDFVVDLPMNSFT